MTKLYAYFGHHKCASTWLASIVKQVCLYTGLEFTSFNNQGEFGGNLRKHIVSHDIDFFAYRNADFRCVESFLAENSIGFHVIRDPRDILVSAYFSHLHSHPTEGWSSLEGQRAQLRDKSKSEGIFLTAEFIENVFEELDRWNYGLPNVLELKFEDVVHSPYQKMLDIFDWLGLLSEADLRIIDQLKVAFKHAINMVHVEYPLLMPYHFTSEKITAEKLLGIVHNKRFSKLAKGRELGEEDVTSHYRKGAPGDWKYHFSTENKQFFKKNYNDLLIKLRYEADTDW
jgi:hypothetical protein